MGCSPLHALILSLVASMSLGRQSPAMGCSALLLKVLTLPVLLER